jgi:hypothetical protein
MVSTLSFMVFSASGLKRWRAVFQSFVHPAAFRLASILNTPTTTKGWWANTNTAGRLDLDILGETEATSDVDSTLLAGGETAGVAAN